MIADTYVEYFSHIMYARNMNNTGFARNLVKGKIAETIFAQMYRETQSFTVLEFGYEKVIPELIQQGINDDSGIVQTLRSAPDFAVINRETKQVSLIEVKYMHTLRHDFVLRDAKRMHESWNPSYLFVATLEGFYFDDIDDIIQNNGEIALLNNPLIPSELQERYLQILKDFENNKDSRIKETKLA